MHRCLQILFGLTIFAVLSCKKSNNSKPAVPQLAGNWSIVNDSTYIHDNGLTTPDTGSNYKGRPGDHFNFVESFYLNGRLYVNENGKADTANYLLSIDNSGVQAFYKTLIYDGVNLENSVAGYQIINLTQHTVTLKAQIGESTGTFFQTVNLKR